MCQCLRACVRFYLYDLHTDTHKHAEKCSDSNNNMKWCSIYVKYIRDLKVEWDCLQPATWRKVFVTERASWQANKTNR